MKLSQFLLPILLLNIITNQPLVSKGQWPNKRTKKLKNWCLFLTIAIGAANWDGICYSIFNWFLEMKLLFSKYTK